MILQHILHNTQLYPYTVILDDANSKCYTPYLLHKIFNAQQTTSRFLCITSQVPSRKPIYRKYKTVINSINTITCDNVDQVIDNVEKFVNKFQDDDIPCIVIVDSLSSIVMQFGFTEALRFIETLQHFVFNQQERMKISSVVSVIHSDVHSGATVFDDEVNALKLRATGVIEIQDAHDLDSTRTYFFGEGEHMEEKIVDKKQIHFKCDLLTMRVKSKLLSHEEFYKVLSEEDCVISHVKHPFIEKKKKNVVHAVNNVNSDTLVLEDKKSTTSTTAARSNKIMTDRPMNKKDIEMQLPFKVELSQKEQEDRERVVLPYVQEGKALNRTLSALPQQQQQNKGFIIVDDGGDDDEYDSDDPDADLDI